MSDDAWLLFRSNAELQAQAIRGMEETRVLGEELRHAKVRMAELAAEVKNKDEALQAKEVLLRGADVPMEVGLALEARASQLLYATEDQKEGMSAFVEKRKASFKHK